MLSMLRNSTSGWLAKIFIFLLVASFAVYGVSASFFSNSTGSVISVGETKVDLLDYRLAYERQVNQLSQSLGTRLTTEQARAFGVEQSVLANLTTGAVLDENSRKMGLGISSDKLAAEIGKDDSFNDATGNFSRDQLRRVLNNIGMSENDYVNNRKSVAIRNQLLEGVSNSAKLPNSFFELVAKSQGEKRVFDYLTVTAADVKDRKTAKPEDLKKYYEDNLATYKAPQYRKAKIVKLEAADIVDEAAVTGDEIAEEYESKKASYTSAEKRKIQQLVFTNSAKAEAAVKRIKEGEAFETIMAEEGKTDKDVDLGGLLAKTGIPDDNIANAAFGLKLNETSDLVDGLFGQVLLRAIEIQPENVKPLDEVEAELRKAIALTKAEDLIFDTHDRFEDERAAGEDLETSAKNVGLIVRTVEAIDRTGRDIEGNIINDLPASQKLIAEIFDTDEATETDPISIGSSGFVWFEVDKITEERQKPQDEVSEQLAKDWDEAELNKAVGLLADAIQVNINDGGSFVDAAKDLLALDEDAAKARILKSEPLLASDTSKDLNQAAVQAAYADKLNAAIVADAVEGNGKIVLKIVEVQENAPLPVAANIQEQLNGNLSNDLLVGLVNELRTKQEVYVNQAAVNAAPLQ